MSPKTALEIYNVLSRIYKEYSGIKGYVTNLTLNNDNNTSHITSFKPNYIFVTSSQKILFNGDKKSNFTKLTVLPK